MFDKTSGYEDVVTLSIKFRALRREYFNPILQDAKLPLFFTALITTIILGYIGLKDSLVHGHPLSILYHTFQLFGLSLELDLISGMQNIPWQLQTARFLAPLISAYAAISALIVIFKDQFNILRAYFIRNHVVICGLSDKGLFFAETFYKKGLPIIIIEKDLNNEKIGCCREFGSIVLTGDATKIDILRRGRIKKAKYLITVCHDDITNIEITTIACDMVKNQKKGVLLCLVHIYNQQLCNRLKKEEIILQKASSYRITFFNIYESGVQVLLDEYPILAHRELLNIKKPGILIMGLSQMSVNLTKNILQHWYYLYPYLKKKLNLTIVYSPNVEKKDPFSGILPNYKGVCKVETITYNEDFKDSFAFDFLTNFKKRVNLIGAYVCFSDDSLNLSVGLNAYKSLQYDSIPVIVKMDYNKKLETLLLTKEAGIGDSSGLYFFGVLNKTCKPELLFGGVHEIIARLLHEKYRNYISSQKLPPKSNPSILSWEDLSEDLKEANLREADHISEKLRMINCGIMDTPNKTKADFKFTKDEIELLMETEHERWCEEQRLKGWKFGPNKDIKKKTNPNMVDWKKLQEDIKELNRNLINEIPKILGELGFQIYRL